MSQRRLSVVIPTWNRAGLVCEAVESALGQVGADLEVIVVDDGSNDGTAEVLERRFGKAIKLLQMATRSGVGAARNEGVRQATGDLLGFLDSDDLWLPGKLKAELDVLERFPDAEAIVSDSRFLVDGQFIGTSRFAQNGVLAGTGGRAQWVGDFPWLWTIPPNGVSTCGMTLCRRTVAKLGQPLFATDLHSCEDWFRCPAVPGLPRRGLARGVVARALDRRRCAHRASVPRAAQESRAGQLGCKRDRLTVIERSIRLDRLPAALVDALADFGCHISSELERLEAGMALDAVDQRR